MTPILLIALYTAPPAAEEVVARVGDEAVTAGELAERAVATRAAGGKVVAADLLEDLVNEVVLAMDGYRLGIDQEPDVVAVYEAARRRAASDRLVEVEIAGAVKIPDEVLEEMYHDVADWARVHVIILATREDAEAAIGRLKKGAKFADEARHSLDPNGAARGGDLGDVIRGQLDRKIAEVAFSAPVGELRGPLQLDLGWAIVKVIERGVGDDAGFEKRKPALREMATKQATAQGRDHFTRQLRAREKVTVDEAFLKGTGTKIEASEAELAHVVAVVGARKLTYRAVLQEVVQLTRGRAGSHLSGPAVKLDFAWAIVDRMLLEDAAMARGFGDDAVAKAAGRRAARSAIVWAYAQRLRMGVKKPTDGEAKSWYQEHVADFKRGERRVCAHLLVKSKAQAQALKKRLDAGESWEDLVQQYSLDAASAAAGGVVGELDEKQLAALGQAGEPALAKGWKGLKPGKVSGPVKSRSGWHLLRVNGVKPADTATFEEVKAAVVKRMMVERGNQAVRDKMAALRSGVKVAIDKKALARAAKRIKRQLGGGQ